MVSTNQRKLLLCGWLKANSVSEYDSPLILQKFLLLYDAFSKVNTGQADFSTLKGYKQGPVFSTVLSDYTCARYEFDKAAINAFAKAASDVNEAFTKLSQFIVKVLTENELSALTHRLNLWKSKEARIMSGERHVELYEDDFNDADTQLIKYLEAMYPLTLISDSHIYS